MKATRRRLRLLFLSGLLLAVGASGNLLARDSQNDARRLLQRGDILPLEKILDAAEESRTGRILEVELEYEHGRYVYEIEILQPDGRVMEYYYDARTAEFLGSEVED